MKENTIDIKQLDTCPACGLDFTCNSQNIQECHCSSVSLNEMERKEISMKYKTCLCHSCLLKIKEEMELSNRNSSGTILTIIGLLFVLLVNPTGAQSYAPAVGQPGTSAMHKDSSAFVNWAKGCSISRGYQDISNKSLGLTIVGDESMATGKALSNAVISLGDSGSVICSFNFPIKNGAGPDFAVFENSIDDGFLELAFVEVSSDGNMFFRFRSHSLIDTLNQTGSFGSTDPTKINNLAGKYRAAYGTPFDLQELAGKNGLDINAITHIKIIDVVGAMNPIYCMRDGLGNKVNDPWPTAFPSGGFDLDAIGVIHQNTITGLEERYITSQVKVFPNPLSVGTTLNICASNASVACELFDLSGQVLTQSNSNQIETQGLNPGIYILKIIQDKEVSLKKIVIQ